MTLAIVHGPDISPERTSSGSSIRLLLDVGGAGGRLARRLVDIPPGREYRGSAGAGGELWFVISGEGVLELDGPEAAGSVPLRGKHGVRLPAGASYCLRADDTEPVRLDAVALPAEVAGAGLEGTVGLADGPLVSDLRDCAVETTGNRRFRVLFGPGLGCPEATQFLGEIPPGRAPDHSHTYDELVLVLDGAGVVHADGADHPIAAGSCVHLPPGQRHCLENTGDATLQVLGVFHPGGSPAAKITPAGA